MIFWPFQVRNNAGGFVFKVDDLARIRRFLILGTSGGTYYVEEKELTIQNLEALIEIIKKGKVGDSCLISSNSFL